MVRALGKLLLVTMALASAAACGGPPRPQVVQSAAVCRVPGALPAESISIREWAVPTPNAIPHDAAVGPDGALWFTEMNANKLGRFDEQAGTFNEIDLTTADSGPHGLAIDNAGNVWFTANKKGYVGRMSPATGRAIQYPMPDPRAKDPHTPVFDRDGALWFTLQESSMVGKLDPKTGAMAFVSTPTPNARPYGIVLGADDAPYVCEFGTNKIARVDPGTMSVREYTLPEGARPRRIARAKSGALYYSDFERGKLGRLDPKTGRVEEWASPSGASSHPYGIAITPNGDVWYSESGVQPNTLVRFDPKREQFLAQAIPSGGGVVRNMAATADGRVYFTCSGTNHVAIASLEHPALARR
jgi:virginiamycin B lyase